MSTCSKIEIQYEEIRENSILIAVSIFALPHTQNSLSLVASRYKQCTSYVTVDLIILGVSLSLPLSLSLPPPPPSLSPSVYFSETKNLKCVHNDRALVKSPKRFRWVIVFPSLSFKNKTECP